MVYEARNFQNQFQKSPDREQTERASKKPMEGFKDYAQRWQPNSFLVQPALTVKVKVTIFMSTLLSTYDDELIGHASVSFTNLVQTGESIEHGLKTHKIKDDHTLFEQSSNEVGGSTRRPFPHKKNESEKEVPPNSKEPSQY